MSLIVSTFHRDPITHAYIDDPYIAQAGRDLAGPEVWRTRIWASSAVVNRGARFLPQLASADVYVEHEDLATFATECQLLIGDVEPLAAELGVDPGGLTYRLENMVFAVQHAKETGGGVYIG